MARSKNNKRTRLCEVLSGGDRRSLGEANRVAAEVLTNSAQLSELIECLWSEYPIVRMRAADAAEKVSRERPKLLQRYKSVLFELAEETSQIEVRWHMAMMIPRLTLTLAERERARAIFTRYLEDRSSIVKTLAIQGLVDLARHDGARREEVIEFLRAVTRSGTPAMKARSRILLAQFKVR